MSSTVSKRICDCSGCQHRQRCHVFLSDIQTDCPSTHSPTSPTHSLTHSPNHSLTHSLTQSLPPLLTHPPTHVIIIDGSHYNNGVDTAIQNHLPIVRHHTGQWMLCYNVFFSPAQYLVTTKQYITKNPCNDIERTSNIR